MKFSMVILLVAVAATQAYTMSPNGLSASMDRNEIDDGPVHAATLYEQLYIPMARYMGCNNSGCNAVCMALGYKHGRCVSDTTCHCYN